MAGDDNNRPELPPAVRVALERARLLCSGLHPIARRELQRTVAVACSAAYEAGGDAMLAEAVEMVEASTATTRLLAIAEVVNALARAGVEIHERQLTRAAAAIGVPLTSLHPTTDPAELN